MEGNGAGPPASAQRWAGRNIAFWNEVWQTPKPMRKPDPKLEVVHKRLQKEQLETIKTNLMESPGHEGGTEINWARDTYEPLSKNFEDMNKEDVFEIVTTAFSSPEPNVAKQAFQAIRLFPREEQARMLEAAFAANTPLPQEAIDLIKQFPEAEQKKLARALFESACPPNKCKAYDFLHLFNSGEQVKMIKNGFVSGNSEVSLRAFESLPTLPALYHRTLIKIAVSQGDYSVSKRALESLGGFPSVPAAEIIKAAASSKDRSIANVALGRTNELGEADREELVRSALKNPNDYIVAVALAKITSLPNENWPELARLALMARSDKSGRTAAGRLPALIEKYGSSKNAENAFEKKNWEATFEVCRLIPSLPNESQPELIKIAASSVYEPVVLEALKHAFSLPLPEHRAEALAAAPACPSDPVASERANLLLHYLSENGSSEKTATELIDGFFPSKYTMFENSCIMAGMKLLERLADVPLGRRHLVLRAAIRSKYADASLNAAKRILSVPKEHRAGLVNEALNISNYHAAVEALCAVPHLEKEEQAPLIKLGLASYSQEVAMKALELAAKLGTPPPAELIRAALGSNHLAVRLEAFKRISECSGAEKLGLLKISLGNDFVEVALEAVKLISSIPGSDQPALIESALQRHSNPNRPHTAALEAVKLIPSMPENAQPGLLETALEYPANEVKTQAGILALSLPRTPQGEKPFYKALDFFYSSKGVMSNPISEQYAAKVAEITPQLNTYNCIRALKQIFEIGHETANAMAARKVCLEVPREYRPALVEAALCAEAGIPERDQLSLLQSIPFEYRAAIMRKMFSGARKEPSKRALGLISGHHAELFPLQNPASGAALASVVRAAAMSENADIASSAFNLLHLLPEDEGASLAAFGFISDKIPDASAFKAATELPQRHHARLLKLALSSKTCLELLPGAIPLIASLPEHMVDDALLQEADSAFSKAFSSWYYASKENEEKALQLQQQLILSVAQFHPKFQFIIIKNAARSNFKQIREGAWGLLETLPEEGRFRVASLACCSRYYFARRKARKWMKQNALQIAALKAANPSIERKAAIDHAENVLEWIYPYKLEKIKVQARLSAEAGVSFEEILNPLLALSPHDISVVFSALVESRVALEALEFIRGNPRLFGDNQLRSASENPLFAALFSKDPTVAGKAIEILPGLARWPAYSAMLYSGVPSPDPVAIRIMETVASIPQDLQFPALNQTIGFDNSNYRYPALRQRETDYALVTRALASGSREACILALQKSEKIFISEENKISLLRAAIQSEKEEVAVWGVEKLSDANFIQGIAKHPKNHKANYELAEIALNSGHGTVALKAVENLSFLALGSAHHIGLALNSISEDAALKALDLLLIGDPEHDALLVEALNSKRPAVASKALGLVQSNIERGDVAEKILPLALDSPNAFVAEGAAELVGKLPAKEREAVIQNALDSKSEQVALKAVGLIDLTNKEEEALIRSAFLSRHPSVAKKMWSLRQTAPKRLHAITWYALYSPHKDVAEEAADAISPKSPNAFDYLKAVLESGTSNAIRSVVGKIPQMASESEREELVKKLFDADSGNFALKAVKMIPLLSTGGQHMAFLHVCKSQNEAHIDQAIEVAEKDVEDMKAKKVYDYLYPGRYQYELIKRGLLSDSEVVALKAVRYFHNFSKNAMALNETGSIAYYNGLLKLAIGSRFEKAALELLKNARSGETKLSLDMIEFAIGSQHGKVVDEAMGLLDSSAVESFPPKEAIEAMRRAMGDNIANLGVDKEKIDAIMQPVQKIIEKALNSSSEHAAMEAAEIIQASWDEAETEEGTKQHYLFFTRQRYELLKLALDSRHEEAALAAVEAIPCILSDMLDYKLKKAKVVLFSEGKNVLDGDVAVYLRELKISAYHKLLMKAAFSSKHGKVRIAAMDSISSMQKRIQNGFLKIALDSGNEDSALRAIEAVRARARDFHDSQERYRLLSAFCAPGTKLEENEKVLEIHGESEAEVLEHALASPFESVLLGAVAVAAGYKGVGDEPEGMTLGHILSGKNRHRVLKKAIQSGSEKVALAATAEIQYFHCDVMCHSLRKMRERDPSNPSIPQDRSHEYMADLVETALHSGSDKARCEATKILPEIPGGLRAPLAKLAFQALPQGITPEMATGILSGIPDAEKAEILSCVFSSNSRLDIFTAVAPLIFTLPSEKQPELIISALKSGFSQAFVSGIGNFTNKKQ